MHGLSKAMQDTDVKWQNGKQQNSGCKGSFLLKLNDIAKTPVYVLNLLENAYLVQKHTRCSKTNLFKMATNTKFNLKFNSTDCYP